MKASEIPAFVDEVVEAGGDIGEVGHDMYAIGDVDDQNQAIEELKMTGDRSVAGASARVGVNRASLSNSCRNHKSVRPRACIPLVSFIRKGPCGPPAEPHMFG
ncbi:hypothetical protein ASE60_29665 [Ensifer sp. Root278]|nr:hypothetical protein ASE60_29665 [Ensifer sp. Root278]